MATKLEKKFLRRHQKTPPPATDLGCRSPPLRESSRASSRNQWFRGIRLLLIEFRVDLLKTRPMHLQSFWLALLILFQNFGLEIALCFPTPVSPQTVEKKTRCRGNRSLKNTRKQPVFTGAVLAEQQQRTVKLVRDSGSCYTVIFLRSIQACYKLLPSTHLSR